MANESKIKIVPIQNLPGSLVFVGPPLYAQLVEKTKSMTALEQVIGDDTLAFKNPEGAMIVIIKDAEIEPGGCSCSEHLVSQLKATLDAMFA